MPPGARPDIDQVHSCTGQVAPQRCGLRIVPRHDPHIEREVEGDRDLAADPSASSTTPGRSARPRPIARVDAADRFAATSTSTDDHPRPAHRLRRRGLCAPGHLPAAGLRAARLRAAARSERSRSGCCSAWVRHWKSDDARDRHRERGPITAFPHRLWTGTAGPRLRDLLGVTVEQPSQGGAPRRRRCCGVHDRVQPADPAVERGRRGGDRGRS